ncbi:EscU/YscU/HrcU family type III secretion system export apparatus switch protein, partial [Geodermatophilus sp. SYSU D00663]
MTRLKMTKYEIQQEHKQSEGDPHVKGQRRSMQL